MKKLFIFVACFLSMVISAHAVNITIKSTTQGNSPTFASLTVTGTTTATGGVKFSDGTTQLTAPAGQYASLATNNTSVGSDIEEYSVASFIVPVAGTYLINAQVGGFSGSVVETQITTYIKTGSSTYASATYRARGRLVVVTADGDYVSTSCSWCGALSAGDTVHLGGRVQATTGNRIIVGDAGIAGETAISAVRVSQ